ncbi:MAG: arginine--tRNA ligase [Bacteroidales bacterium]|nr:arginine--tRNA ligase [Bacteroidales bacterium]
MIHQHIIKSTIKAIDTLYGVVVEEKTVSVQKTRKEFTGDFTLVVFPFLKYSKKQPDTTAKEIGTFLSVEIPLIERFNIINGFLNLELKDAYWIQFLMTEGQNQSFGTPIIKNPITYVVEYSSPNTNKPLHLGHIRNNLLGQSVSEILAFSGHKVFRVNLVNDRGIHICKSMLAWQKWSHENQESDKGMKGDHLAGKYYVMFENEYRKQIEDLKNKGKSEDQAKEEAPLINEARELLRLWEDKDIATRSLWQKMNDMVFKGFDVTYEKLGISFDKTYYESETYLEGKKIVENGLKSGIFYQKPDNSVWIDLTTDGLDEKLLLRADGTSVYITQDLGTAFQRYDDYKADKYLYVVGNEQNYHFDILKQILLKLKSPVAGNLFHLSYGMVELPDGKMKSREGKVVDADDLIEEMFFTAKKQTESLGKIEGFSENEANALFHKLSMGALKYFILKVDPKKNMVFNPEESIDFNGNTGPFIQYAYVRIMSIVRKTENTEISKSYDFSKLNMNHNEKSLLKLIYSFPEIIQDAAETLSPALLANYLYDLAKEFNQYYHECPIIKEAQVEKAALRLHISVFCAGILKKGMALLGIEMPDKM